MALVMTASLSACTRRDAPYRFQAPVVAAVRAERLPPPAPAAAHGPADASGAWIAYPQTSPPEPRQARRRSHQPAAATAPAATPADRVSRALRALVDRPASQATSAQHALAILASMGAQLDAPLRRVTTGADLLVLAEARDALTGEPPLTGDLVLLEPGGDADPIVGIVVTAAAPAAARGQQATEIVYLAAGVVHRGFIRPARAGRRGKARNRVVCADASAPPARCATDKRFRAYLRLDRLTR